MYILYTYIPKCNLFILYNVSCICFQDCLVSNRQPIYSSLETATSSGPSYPQLLLFSCVELDAREFSPSPVVSSLFSTYFGSLIHETLWA